MVSDGTWPGAPPASRSAVQRSRPRPTSAPAPTRRGPDPPPTGDGLGYCSAARASLIEGTRLDYPQVSAIPREGSTTSERCDADSPAREVADPVSEGCLSGDSLKSSAR